MPHNDEAMGVVSAVVMPHDEVSVTPVVPADWAAADGRVYPVWFSGARVNASYDNKHLIYCFQCDSHVEMKTYLYFLFKTCISKITIKANLYYIIGRPSHQYSLVTFPLDDIITYCVSTLF